MGANPRKTRTRTSCIGAEKEPREIIPKDTVEDEDITNRRFKIKREEVRS